MAKLRINTPSIVHNFEKLKNQCEARGIQLVPVTKVCLSNRHIVESFQRCGAETIADSDARRLSRLDVAIGRFLLKVSLSDAMGDDLSCDCVITSSVEVLQALSTRANTNPPKVFLALELGDLREGIVPERLPGFLESALKLPNISIVGLGANFGCLSGKLPDRGTCEILRETLHLVRKRIGFEFEHVSFGGTAVYPSLMDGSLPDFVNHLRIGEAIFFGHNLCTNESIPGMNQETFILSSEILEVSEKNVHRDGEYGLNAFGEDVAFVDSGVRKRAILDFGQLGAPIRSVFPRDDRIRIVGSTHEYSVIDISDTIETYRVGDSVEFTMNYNSAAQAYLSPQIENLLD